MAVCSRRTRCTTFLDEIQPGDNPYFEEKGAP